MWGMPRQSFTISAASTAVSGSTSGASVGSSSPTATVTSTGGIPAGTVDFYDSTTMTDLGSASLNSAGMATLNPSVPLEAGAQCDRTVLHQQHERLQLFQHDAQRERASLCLRAECDGRRGPQRFG